MKFVKANKRQAKLRMAITGVSGGGKTFSALAIATVLGNKVALIDTERASASKYADKFNFDVLELDNFSPKSYIEAIKAAESEGYEVLVIDSFSHAWVGAGGALEMVDAEAKRSQSKNTFGAWRSITPEYNKLIDCILRANCHVIATMRSKTAYDMEKDDRGRVVPVKVGLQAVQRDSVEYEFDVVADMTTSNDMIIGKTRCSELAGMTFNKPGSDVANILKGWLSDGAPVSLIDVLKNDLSRVTTKAEQERVAANIKANKEQLSPSELEELQTMYKNIKVA